MEAPAVKVESVVAKFVGRSVILDTGNGDPQVFTDPADVVAWIQRRDRRRARRNPGAIRATRIAWTNVPDGFTPPVPS